MVRDTYLEAFGATIMGGWDMSGGGIPPYPYHCPLLGGGPVSGAWPGGGWDQSDCCSLAMAGVGAGAGVAVGS